ncbi:MAG: zinc transport system ATP-binding protein [Candidatus Methanomethylophilaceae archaeon]|nr:zinc transport system ATP-binding protein [Candidatus Methanomethylophilaceae archaeon]MDI3542375.1 zinc transport system ATP-binding protein [Candidatus Methanomethylophilaceae archaeon]
MDESNPIEIRGLSAGYGHKIVIEDINMDLRKNDFLAVIGPNGGGKTTLLKAILGIIEPLSGSIRIFGEEPEKGVRRIGYVPQNGSFDNLYPVSVYDVVLMGTRSRKGLRPGYGPDEHAAAEEAMKKVRISELADSPISALSGGQLQRCLLARALACEPDILLLDEPTASLDPDMKECVYDTLKRINEKTAIMIVTHDMGVIAAQVKRVACLNRRMIVHDEASITPEMMELGYHCPMELLAHGVPHRTLGEHAHD